MRVAASQLCHGAVSAQHGSVLTCTFPTQAAYSCTKLASGGALAASRGLPSCGILFSSTNGSLFTAGDVAW